MSRAVEERAIKFYKEMRANDEPEFKGMYTEIIEDEKKHWDFLDKEAAYSELEAEDWYDDKNALKILALFNQFFKM